MKKIIFLFLGVSFLLFGCSSEKKFKKMMDEQDNKLLTQALQLGDVQTAIYATQSLITRDTGNIQYLDTLALLYQNSNNQMGLMQVSRRLLVLNPNNVAAQENLATSAKGLQLYQDALNSYSQLFGTTQNTRYLYEIADIYFKVNNVAEGKKVFEQILNNPKSKSDNISMLAGQGNVIQVPVVVASLNYLGFYEATQKNYEFARNLYLKALELYPGFVIAKNNLANLEQVLKTAPNNKKGN
jgi:tetratricopeptide (TPR) repeat protein